MAEATQGATGFQKEKPTDNTLLYRGPGHPLANDELEVTSLAIEHTSTVATTTDEHNDVSAAIDSDLNAEKTTDNPNGTPSAPGISAAPLRAAYEYIELPALKPALPRPVEIASKILDSSAAASLVYFLCTLQCANLKAFRSGDSWIVPSLFVAAKSCNYSVQLLDHIWRLTSGFASKRDPCKRLRIVGPNVPTVDLIITVCGEQVEIVTDTIHAACTQDYPYDKYRVIISDDGEDDKLREAVMYLQHTYSNLMYFRRVKPTEKYHGAKAGNLNAVFRETSCEISPGISSILGGPSEFFAIFDADMMPDEETLRALAAQITQNDLNAMATLPQHFMNIPASDPLNQDMKPHGNDEEVMRDRLDAAWCPGSGFMLRRSALGACPGKMFPEKSIAEDVLFSWLLQGVGLKTVYVNECLQWGLQPNSLVSHIKQRDKWSVGHINNSIALGFCISHPNLVKMLPMQRLAAVSYSIRPWLAIPKSIGWLLKGVCVVSSRPLIAATTIKDLHSRASSYLVVNLLTRLNEVSLSKNFSYWVLRRQNDSNNWMSVYLSLGILKELKSKYFGAAPLGFEATGSMKTDMNERDDSARPTLVKRIQLLHKDLGILYLAGFFYIVVVFILRNALRANSFQQALTIALFPGFGFEQLPAFLVPLCYAINPPTDCERSLYLNKDEKTGVSRASNQARRRKFPKRILLLEIPQALSTLWAIYVWYATSEYALNKY